MPTKTSAIDRFWNHLTTKLRKRLRLGHSLNELDPDLIALEQFIHAPEFTPELLAAIKLISPQFHLRPNDVSKKFWELNQNGLCWGEYQALQPFIDSLGAPSKVLDIGPGLGRSVVFLKQVRDWAQVPFHLYESTGDSTRYTKAGPRFEDSFCGNLDALTAVLEHNKIEQYQIFDAQDLDAKLANLPGPYDFIYSFFAVGFHWSIEHFLDEILGLMHEQSIGAFTLHDRYSNFDGLKQLPHRVIEFQKSWPRDRWARLLVIAKNEETLAAADVA